MAKKLGQLRRKAGTKVACKDLASSLISRLQFYYEQLEDPAIRKGRLAKRCLRFQECRDEVDQIPKALQRAIIAKDNGDACSAISDAADGLKSMYRVEGFLKGAELMEQEE